MTISEAAFKARWPEFESADSDLIELVLVEAQNQANATVLGNSYTEYVLTLAADMLATHPFGQPMRLSDNTGQTIYARLLDRIRKQKTFGLRHG